MQVRIYKNAKSPSQSGQAGDFWSLEFVTPADGRFKESLMGRTASNNMANEVKIKFPTLEEATAFATKQHYDFEVVKPKEPRLITKTYASNFG